MLQAEAVSLTLLTDSAASPVGSQGDLQWAFHHCVLPPQQHEVCQAVEEQPGNCDAIHILLVLC